MLLNARKPEFAILVFLLPPIYLLSLARLFFHQNKNSIFVSKEIEDGQ